MVKVTIFKCQIPTVLGLRSSELKILELPVGSYFEAICLSSGSKWLKQTYSESMIGKLALFLTIFYLSTNFNLIKNLY